MGKEPEGGAVGNWDSTHYESLLRQVVRADGTADSSSGFCENSVAGRGRDVSDNYANNLDPTRIDYIALTCDGAAVVGSQEEDKASDFFRQNHFLQGLVAEDFGLIFLREP
jgi:hypothetical protein